MSDPFEKLPFSALQDPDLSNKDDRDTQKKRSGMFERIGQSVTRGPVVPKDDTDRKLIVVNNLILHNRPVRVDARTLRYTHTFGLGGMSAVLFGLLVATGVLLMFVYEPSPGLAYESIVTLQTSVLFGKLVRNIHHWSANFLIAIVLLHLLRVFFTGGFYAPRQFNWILGLLLLCCVLVSNFTGYLLPWDQLSYWAITIVTGMLGYIPLAGDLAGQYDSRRRRDRVLDAHYILYGSYNRGASSRRSFSWRFIFGGYGGPAGLSFRSRLGRRRRRNPSAFCFCRTCFSAKYRPRWCSSPS